MFGAPKNWSPRARTTRLVDAESERVVEAVEFEASSRALWPEAEDSWYAPPAQDGESVMASASTTVLVAVAVVVAAAVVVVVAAAVVVVAAAVALADVLATSTAGVAAADWVEAA